MSDACHIFRCRAVALAPQNSRPELSERTAAWVESEVDVFTEARLAERDRQGAKRAPLESPYMRLSEIMKRTGLESATIYELIRKGTFPKWA